MKLRPMEGVLVLIGGPSWQGYPCMENPGWVADCGSSQQGTTLSLLSLPAASPSHCPQMALGTKLPTWGKLGGGEPRC